VRWVVVWDDMYVEPISGLPKATRQLLQELTGPPVIQDEHVAVYDLAALHGSGELTAPVWRTPATVRTGDGVRPVKGRIPPTQLFERAR
jgi:hypothetical protein